MQPAPCSIPVSSVVKRVITSFITRYQNRRTDCHGVVDFCVHLTQECHMSFTKLTDTEEKELLRLNRFYFEEAKRCEAGKAYLARCIMLGSALETLLTLMVNVHSDDAENTGKL